MARRDGLSRREFLTVGAAGLAAAAGGARLLGAALPGGRLAFLDASAAKPITRTLGRTGLKLPIVNMGVMNANLPDLVKASYEAGVRYFDTAAVYQRGQNEIMVGRVIKEMNIRNDVVIGTKFMVPFEARTKLSDDELETAVLDSAAGSLKRLETDHLDILYVHNVSDAVLCDRPGVLRAFEKMKKSGQVRFAGISTHEKMPLLLEYAAAKKDYDVVLVTYNYALQGDSDMARALEKAAAAGIGIVAMKTQCSQAWYAHELPPEMKAYYEGGILHTAVLKWALQNANITTAIPGYVNYDQMKEDLSVNRSLGYTAEEKKFLEDRQVRLATEAVCQQCSKCVPSCPMRTDVPTLVRAHMYALAYGNMDEARRTLETMPAGRSLDNCRACRACTAACVRRVDIPGRLAELRSVLA